MFSILFKYFYFRGITMVGVNKIPVTNKEFNDYKKVIDNNKSITLPEYISNLIKNELTQVKKQKGKCNIRSNIKQIGELKGSCRWYKKYYKVIVWRWDETKQKSLWSKSIGYFDDLYHAEQVLNELFLVETEDELLEKLEEKKVYYQKKYKLENNPTLADTTYTIKSIYRNKLNSRKKKSLTIEFQNTFINPNTNKHQKNISFGRQYLDEYTADAIISECIEIDDPIKILDYRTKLEYKVNPNKYIHKSSKSTWKINKEYNGKTISIGSYNVLEEARKDRDILVKNNWDKKIIEEIKLTSSNVNKIKSKWDKKL